MQYTVNDGFPYYIELTEGEDYRQLFTSPQTFDLLKTISEEQSAYRYAPGKWSIKQIVGHITDHERIMVYRALRFSRKDPTLLPGYDQNLLVENSRFDDISYEELIKDFENVRASSNSFINMLSAEQLQLKGKAWKYELTVEEFLKAIVGHELHHVKILKERYLKN